MSAAKKSSPAVETRAPQETAELIGQGQAEAALIAAQKSGRMPHAWLFHGPRGVGKATLAYRFARFLFAGGHTGQGEGGGLFGDAEPVETLALDPEDPVFRRVAAGGQMDLSVLSRGVTPQGKPKRDIAVEDVRAAIDTLRLTSAEGGWRILILDSADDLNPSSANALLKILEEPPQGAILLLISHRPGALLPTIRSRCRNLPLRPLALGEVESLLAEHRPELAMEDIPTLARLSEGSIGRALELCDGGGLELYREVVSLLESLPRLDVGRLHGLGDRLARDTSGAAFRTFGELLTAWLARMIRANSLAESGGGILPGEEALMRGLMERRGLAPWLALWEKLVRTFAQTEAVSLDRKQVLIASFLEMQSLAGTAAGKRA